MNKLIGVQIDIKIASSWDKFLLLIGFYKNECFYERAMPKR